MHEVDREKFGKFLTQLRKEKGLTQKELASELYVSDKAVSKWERGMSLPDIGLLQPIAETLGVSVTELLRGEHVAADQLMSIREVEPLVTGALTMTAQEQEEQREHRKQWGRWYFLALAAFIVEIAVLWSRGNLWDELSSLTLVGPVMGAIFGAYAIFGAKEKIPGFYDQHKLNFYSDGVFRMNVPGVYFNNRNWPHILNAIRVWSCLILGGWIAVYTVIKGILTALGLPVMAAFVILLPLSLGAILGGLFIPVYAVGRKYG